jgi:hypothetical protein
VPVIPSYAGKIESSAVPWQSGQKDFETSLTRKKLGMAESINYEARDLGWLGPKDWRSEAQNPEFKSSKPPNKQKSSDSEDLITIDITHFRGTIGLGLGQKESRVPRTQQRRKG